MSDVFNAEKRSAVMARIRGRGNASTEMAMVALLRKSGVTGWRRHVEMRPRLAPEDKNRKSKNGRIRVRPDFVFRTGRIAVFVDGCFWHGCPLHATTPKQNAEFWFSKLQANAQRDAANTRALTLAGWKVFRFWEHDLREPAALLARLMGALADAPGACPQQP